MTRAEYIDRVKVKLDEFSPFEEPSSFIAADGDADYDRVKPVIEYIDKELDNATNYCLRVLPLRVLSSDANIETEQLTINNGVGIVTASYSNKRLCRVIVADWKRDVTHFYTSEDVEYLLQQNEYTRSGIAKPSVFYVPELDCLELYSFPSTSTTNSVDIWSIDLNTKPESVASYIADFIIIKCAQLVYSILGNTNGAAAMESEFARKLEAL